MRDWKIFFVDKINIYLYFNFKYLKHSKQMAVILITFIRYDWFVKQMRCWNIFIANYFWTSAGIGNSMEVLIAHLRNSSTQLLGGAKTVSLSVQNNHKSESVAKFGTNFRKQLKNKEIFSLILIMFSRNFYRR